MELRVYIGYLQNVWDPLFHNIMPNWQSRAKQDFKIQLCVLLRLLLSSVLLEWIHYFENAIIFDKMADRALYKCQLTIVHCTNCTVHYYATER